MITVLLIMIAGIAFGWLIQKRKKVVKFINSSIIWIIFLLLFFMGIAVGGNPEIMQNLPTIGLKGLILSVAAVLGSVILAWAVYFFILKDSLHER